MRPSCIDLVLTKPLSNFPILFCNRNRLVLFPQDDSQCSEDIFERLQPRVVDYRDYKYFEIQN